MLTQDEAELYDRQIRLWGVNAQSRLRQSKVLMLGFNGVASEVAKILVLAGIDSLTIVDDQELTDDDIYSNLFCRQKDETNKYRTHQVKEKLRILNPLVKVTVDNSCIEDKKPDSIIGYDLVTLHTFLSIEKIIKLNNMCRSHCIKFYLVLDFGFFGFMFNDLGKEFKFSYESYEQNEAPKQSGEAKDPIDLEDDYEDSNSRPKKRQRLENPIDIPNKDRNYSSKDKKKQNAETLRYSTFEEMISLKCSSFDRKSSPVLFLSIAMMKFFSAHGRRPKCPQDLSKLNEIMASIKDSLNLPDSILKKLNPEWSQNISSSISPVCAIIGGIAGQDIIRALSGRDIPIYNTFSFDGLEMTGVVEKLAIDSFEKSGLQPVIRDIVLLDDD